MKVALIVVGLLVAAIGVFIVWRLWDTYTGGGRSYVQLAARIESVERRLVAGENPDPADLERFAQDRATRKVLYDALEHHEKLPLFPSKYRTREAMAEADLVVWLNHPNELGSVPDEMELMATLPVPAAGFENQRYFLFRFRMKPPHSAAKDGWLAGVAGPYPIDGPVGSGASGTFSRFEPYDSKSPEEHVRSTHQLVVERR
jgi:hypothetical protein